MNKQITKEEAVEAIGDRSTIMIGGFMCAGSPHTLIEALVVRDIKELTLIVNDTGYIDQGIGKLIAGDQVSKVMASHIGTNKQTGNKMTEGVIQVQLIPQGTLAEQIRSAGVGLGGFLTPTGLGTVVQEGKQVLRIDGKDYLLEKPLKADVALIKAYRADAFGNLTYRLSARNFNPLMAMAADYVIAEVDEILEEGCLPPDEIITPGIFIDKIVIKERAN